MSKYLYIFGYETPRQRENNAAHEWDDEDSAAVFIEAETERQALEWGYSVSKEFVKALFDGGDAPWDASRFAAWVDSDYAQNYSPAQLATILTVRCGDYPDIDKMLGIISGEATTTAATLGA